MRLCASAQTRIEVSPATIGITTISVSGYCAGRVVEQVSALTSQGPEPRLVARQKAELQRRWAGELGRAHTGQVLNRSFDGLLVALHPGEQANQRLRRTT